LIPNSGGAEFGVNFVVLGGSFALIPNSGGAESKSPPPKSSGSFALIPNSGGAELRVQARVDSWKKDTEGL
jgi:hypothetical protein